MADTEAQSVYYVVRCTLAYGSFDEVQSAAPEDVAAHIRRSQELHAQGTLLMAGVFLDRPDEPLRSMAVLTTREAAEDYIRDDIFYRKGLMPEWEIRAWANMFA